MISRRYKFGLIAFAVILATSVFVCCASASAEEPEMEWNKTFGGPEVDKGYSVQQTSDGGYIIAGETYSFGVGDSDVCLIKTDENGELEWDRTFGGSADDRGKSVQQTSDGGYIIAGETYSFGAGDSDVCLIKTDEKGGKEWSKTFGGTDWDEGYSVQQTSDDGYIIAGETGSFGAGGSDVWLVKTDEKGEEEWNKTFGGGTSDHGYSVEQTSDGGYIIAGETYCWGGKFGELYLIKTDEKGEEEWSKMFSERDWTVGYSVEQTSDGGYIIAGGTWWHISDVYLIKTDEDGEEEWSKTFGGRYTDYAKSVEQTSDGGYIIAGMTESFGAGDSDVSLIKTDENGVVKWSKTFGGAYEDDRGESVQQTTDGGYIIAGFTNSFEAGDADVWLIKVTPAVAISIYTDKYTYVAGETMHLGLDVANPGDALNVSVNIWLEMPVPPWEYILVDVPTVTLPAGLDYCNPDFKVFKLPNIPDGRYAWHAMLEDPLTGEILSESTAPWYVSAEEPKVEWSKTFGGADEAYGKSVQQTSDGGYIIAGYTNSFGAGELDVYLIKTDENGEEEWGKTFGGADDDWGRSVRQTSDGGYIIAGETNSFGAGRNDVYLIKTDENGEEEWSKTFGGSSCDHGYSVRQTSDGGYIIAGDTGSFGAGLDDVYLIKSDEDGEEEWNKTLGGSNTDRGYSVEQTSDGGYIITGETNSFGAGLDDVYLIKTDENGDEVWSKTFGESHFDTGNSVQQITDGGYIIAGETNSFGAGWEDNVYLIKTDENGGEEWNKTFGGTEWDCGNSIQQTTEGGYIIAGFTCSFGAKKSDGCLIKTDEEGELEWSRIFGGRDYDMGYSVMQTSDGGYIIAGDTRSSGDWDVGLIKLAPIISESATPREFVGKESRTEDITEMLQPITSIEFGD